MVDWIRWCVRASGLAVVIAVTATIVFSSLWKGFSFGPAALGGLVLASSLLSWPRMPKSWRRDPPTERQLEFATKLGIIIPDGISKGELSDMISAARDSDG